MLLILHKYDAINLLIYLFFVSEKNFIYPFLPQHRHETFIYDNSLKFWGTLEDKKLFEL